MQDYGAGRRDTGPYDAGPHDTGRRRLDPRGDDDWAAGNAGRRRAVQRRDAGVRQTRRISSWTAAALVAGVAASAGYFAHAVTTPAATTSGTSGQGTSSAGTGATTVGTTGQKPSVTHAVVTSGGSGVTAGSPGGSAGAGGAAGAGGSVHWRDN